MPTPKIIEIDEEQEVTLCPICSTPAIDEDGLVNQPSCGHIQFVWANGECFEFSRDGLEERLDAAQEHADSDGLCFDPWAWLVQCAEADVILEQTTDDVGCGSLRFRVWIGIRETPKDSSPRRRRPVGSVSDGEYSAHDQRQYFYPTPRFVRWMKTRHGQKHICEIGAGVGHVAKALGKAGMHVTAIDLEPRAESEFPVVQGDSTQHQFEKDSVVLICRPCHNGFVRDTILRALTCGVRDIIYVGLQRNVRADLGGYFRQFTQRRISGIGHADEHIWEMKISRALADACLRRGAIPPLST
jgi:hypothetical protein